MASRLKWINLALRSLMETGIVAAFAYWGFHTGQALGTKVLFGVGAPLVGFGVWGTVDFHRSGKLSEPLRLIEELIISGLAAVALYTSGQHVLGWTLGALSIVYHALVYASGGSLLKSQAVSPAHPR